jgi:hypothetical protein
MSAKLGVLIIHGMGKQKGDFADDLIEGLVARLGSGVNDVVAFEPCYWAPVLQVYQDNTWDLLNQATRMDAKLLRNFVVSYLGDPVSYLSGYYKPRQHGYSDVHRCVLDSLCSLESKLEPGSPLIVLAHSLGSVIINNYIWDEQRPKSRNKKSALREKKTPFQKAETLTSFITYGSNIPLFLPPQTKIECIRFPSPNLPEHYKKIAKWINVYDPDDILGYPLSTIWTETHGTIIEDKTIDVGFWPISETPFSHAFYHKDNDFIDIVVKEIEANLAVARPVV